ncbi:MAG: hypothetical protein ABJR05_01450 [Balneola sp.]
MFSVVNSENQAIVSYMEEEGYSYAMPYSYPVSQISENAYIPGASQEVKITELDERSILGYTAKGTRLILLNLQ